MHGSCHDVANLGRCMSYSCALYNDSLETAGNQSLQRRLVLSFHGELNVAQPLDVDGHKVDDVVFIIGAVAWYNERCDILVLEASCDDTFDDFTTSTGRVAARLGPAVRDELGFMLDANMGDENVVHNNYRYE